MAEADYFADGEWNFYCDLCGKKAKSSTAMKTWDNFRVCSHHKEKRNPQDFLRGVTDNPSVPWTRPLPPYIFILGLTSQPASHTIGGSAIDTFTIG